MAEPATRAAVEQMILTEYGAFLADDLAGNLDAATEHYNEMDRLLEVYLRIPAPRPPS